MIYVLYNAEQMPEGWWREEGTSKVISSKVYHPTAINTKTARTLDIDETTEANIRQTADFCFERIKVNTSKHY